MKWFAIRFIAIVGIFVFIGNGHGALVGNDDFNDNSMDSSKWAADITISGGILAETNTRLEFTSSGSGLQESRRPWILEAPPATSDWAVQMDVAINSALAAADQYTSFGIDVSKAVDPNAFAYVELYNSTLGGGPQSRGFYTELCNNSITMGSNDSLDLGTTFGAVRFSFDSSTGILRSYYDANGSAGGYSWTELASFGISASGGGTTANANWAMSADDNFLISVYGYSEDFAVTSGHVFGDNFSAVPEPSSVGTLTALLLVAVGCMRAARKRRGTGSCMSQ